jgi:hypothetical protein
VRLPHEIQRVFLPLTGDAELEARTEGDALRVIVPSVRGHQIVVFAY